MVVLPLSHHCTEHLVNSCHILYRSGFYFVLFLCFIIIIFYYHVGLSDPSAGWFRCSKELRGEDKPLWDGERGGCHATRLGNTVWEWKDEWTPPLLLWPLVLLTQTDVFLVLTAVSYTFSPDWRSGDQDVRHGLWLEEDQEWPGHLVVICQWDSQNNKDFQHLLPANNQRWTIWCECDVLWLY